MRVQNELLLEFFIQSEQDFDYTDVLIRDGIMVVPKGTVLADGWKL